MRAGNLVNTVAEIADLRWFAPVRIMRRESPLSEAAQSFHFGVMT
jgi:hypothetical protein